MMIRYRSRTLLLITALASSLAAASSAAGATRMTPTPQTVTTKSYVFKLTLGMPEQMWTPAQVRAKHPKTGEVMLAGSMSGAMSMGGTARHLEVHIISRATGKVVAAAHPTIIALDTTAKAAMTIKVPVAEMEGVTEGAADLHYGNNVHLVAGHAYTITVKLNGERAVFHTKA